MNKKVVLLFLILMLSLSYGCNNKQISEPSLENTTNKPETNKAQTNKAEFNKDKTDKIKWNTYNNERFDFNIKYPENFGYTEADNGDGITFLTGDKDSNISVYAAHIIDDVSDPFSALDKYDLKKELKELENGIEATILRGTVDSNYHYEVICISDDVEYHFLSITSVDYYIDNKDTIEEMANSFDVPINSSNKDLDTDYEIDKDKDEDVLNERNNSKKENNNSSDNNEFTENNALSVYQDFLNRIYITYNTDSDKVYNYNTKAELVDYISEVADRSLAQGYVDYYYSEQDDGLYMDAQEKTEEIDFSIPYKFNQIDYSNYELIQEANNEFDEPGRYRLTVSFSYKNNQWIISNENVEQIK